MRKFITFARTHYVFVSLDVFVCRQHHDGNDDNEDHDDGDNRPTAGRKTTPQTCDSC